MVSITFFNILTKCVQKKEKPKRKKLNNSAFIDRENNTCIDSINDIIHRFNAAHEATIKKNQDKIDG